VVLFLGEVVDFNPLITALLAKKYFDRYLLKLPKLFFAVVVATWF